MTAADDEDAKTGSSRLKKLEGLSSRTEYTSMTLEAEDAIHNRSPSTSAAAEDLEPVVVDVDIRLCKRIDERGNF